MRKILLFVIANAITAMTFTQTSSLNINYETYNKVVDYLKNQSDSKINYNGNNTIIIEIKPSILIKNKEKSDIKQKRKEKKLKRREERVKRRLQRKNKRTSNIPL